MKRLLPPSAEGPGLILCAATSDPTCRNFRSHVPQLRPVCVCMLSHSVESDSLQSQGLEPARLLCPWDCQVVRTGKRSPKWQWLEDKEGKSPRKQNKGLSKDQSEDLKQNKWHSWPAQFTQGRPRGEERTYKKRSPRARGLSPVLACTLCLSFSLSLSLICVSFGLACPHASWMYFPLIF